MVAYGPISPPARHVGSTPPARPDSNRADDVGHVHGRGWVRRTAASGRRLPASLTAGPVVTGRGLGGDRVLAIRLYDLETGHVETLAQVHDAAHAEAWIETFRAGGVGTNDVLYTVEVPGTHPARSARRDGGPAAPGAPSGGWGSGTRPREPSHRPP